MLVLCGTQTCSRSSSADLLCSGGFLGASWLGFRLCCYACRSFRRFISEPSASHSHALVVEETTSKVVELAPTFVETSATSLELGPNSVETSSKSAEAAPELVGTGRAWSKPVQSCANLPKPPCASS